MMTRLLFVLGLVFAWPLAILAGIWMLIRSAFAVLIKMAALAVPAAGQQVGLDATPVGDNAQLDASAAK